MKNIGIILKIKAIIVRLQINIWIFKKYWKIIANREISDEINKKILVLVYDWS